LTLPAQIAKNLRDVHFGGNWTAVNLKDVLKDVTWEQAVKKHYSFNTIAALVFHINYYQDAILNLLKGIPLNAKDELSFNLPPVQDKDDWDNLLNKLWSDAETLAAIIETLPETKMWDDFWNNKYGNYYRNFTGIIEHCHYHLGQIVLIKKLSENTSSRH
jgi:hypothetical protein